MATWRAYSELKNTGTPKIVLARMPNGVPLLITVECRKGEWQNKHSQTVGIGTHWLDMNECGVTAGELVDAANSALLCEIETPMEHLTKTKQALDKLKK